MEIFTGDILRNPAGLISTGTAYIIPSAYTSGLQLYNAADQTTNYERLQLLWDSDIATIKTQNAGSGLARGMIFRTYSGAYTNAFLSITSPLNPYPRFWFDSSTSGVTGDSYRFGGGNTATSGTVGWLAITPDYNQASGTAANTDLKIARTETALGSGAQYMIACYAGAAGTTLRATLNNSGYLTLGSVTPTTTTALHTPAGTTGASSLRIPHGSAPTSPVDGDMWTTTSGLFVRINGSTVGPLS